MRINALSVANYLIDLAHADSDSITQLGLMKRVYAAHGFALALLDKPLLDERFDSVEAWRYGPVIPSVYHSFKNYKANPITDKTVLMEWNAEKGEPEFVTPKLEDDHAKIVVDMVWRRYKGYTDSEMVSLMHKQGTPWYWCYEENKNNPIPDSYTKLYYKNLVENLTKK